MTTSESWSTVLTDELGEWVKKFERLRQLVSAELGLPDFDALAVAESRGYRRAIEALRDDDRYRNWWSSNGTLPDGPIRRHLADYLETIAEDPR